MTWYLTAPSHYLSQCWPTFVLPYGVTRPQWVKVRRKYPTWLFVLKIQRPIFAQLLLSCSLRPVRSNPADTWRKNNVIITSKRRRWDLIMTLFLRRVSSVKAVLVSGFDKWRNNCNFAIFAIYGFNLIRGTIECYIHILYIFSAHGDCIPVELPWVFRGAQVRWGSREYPG